MPLGIGNNLIRNGGGLNPDKLALDLQFAADKAYAADGTVVNGTGQFNITSRKGPPAKFTRGSGATFVDSDGLIKYAPENLLLWSEDFSMGTWSKSGVTVDANSIASPSGAVTADMIIENTANSLHGVRQTVTTPIGTSYAYSIYLKAAGRNFALIYSDAGSGFGRYISIPADGSGGVLGNANANDASVTLQYLSNGWYRATLLVTSTRTTTMIEAYASNNGTTATYTGDGTSGIFLWGAQLERHTSARAYIPTTTAVAYAPRFDHDPVTLASRGLLIEEQRTNLQPHSSDYTQTTTSWSTTTGMNTAVLASTISPDGTQNGVLISENTANSVHRTSSASITGTSQPYTASIFVKAGPSPRRYISFGFVFQNFRVIWDTQTSSFAGVTPGTIAPTSYSSQNFGNGWHRLFVTATPSVGSIGVGALLYNGAESYAGDGTSNAYLWGAQLEAGSFPTSYIPTTTSALTRSADVCNITGAAFSGMWNASEGSIFIRHRATGAIGNRFIFMVSNNTDANAIDFRCNNSGVAGNMLTSGASQFTGFNATYAADSTANSALAFSLNNCAFSVNGASAIIDTSATLPVVNRLDIGNRFTGSFNINGTISAIRYYKKRLPNAKLQDLTV